jgi:hypothetical protein
MDIETAYQAISLLFIVTTLVLLWKWCFRRAKRTGWAIAVSLWLVPAAIYYAVVIFDNFFPIEALNLHTIAVYVRMQGFLTTMAVMIAIYVLNGKLYHGS